MPAIFVRDLYSTALQNPQTLQAHVLLSVFFAVSAYPQSFDASPQSIVGILIASASQGSLPAQGIVGFVAEYFNHEAPQDQQEEILRWTCCAIATGSQLALRTKENLDEDMALEALVQFRKHGGYNPYYTRVPSTPDHGRLEVSGGYTKLHWLAAYGSVDETRTLLETNRSELDCLTEDGETALYLACARGCWQIAQILLDKGANAAIQCTPMMISCLHWIFTFEEIHQATAARALIAAGNDINAMAPQVTPFVHYPFTLPPGTPLHWSVSLRAYQSVENLINCGASLYARNGLDPYTDDDRVRILNKFGGPNMKPYSLPSDALLGLAPLDYAAMGHDDVVFQILIQSGKFVDINDTDEEGLNLFHRLSASALRWTRNGNTYEDFLFRGTVWKQRQSLKRTIEAISALGGNLEQMTTPAVQSGQISEGQRTMTFPRRTPLMMAVLAGLPDVVEALLDAGANVNAQDDFGRTALLCVSEKEGPATAIMGTLIKHGANVNHTSHLGTTPIVVAATRKFPGMVELLLSEGADLESKAPITKEGLSREGKGVIGLLAWQEPPLEDHYDATIFELLERHVFSIPDRKKQARILGTSDIDGRTPLHEFVWHCMPRCVQALVCHGAPVNATEYCFKRERNGDDSVKVSWYETPLDLAIRSRDRQLEDAGTKSNLMAHENERLYEKLEEIVGILEKADGATLASEVSKRPFIFDKRKFGPQGFVRALREC
jgi:ankyrin repeat protein